MGLSIRVCLGVASVMFCFFVLRLVATGKLLLKYSLLWLLLCFALLFCAIFPSAVYSISEFFGILAPSNFVFLVGIALLFAVALSLSVVVSKQVDSIKNLTQRVAILEKEADEFRDHR